MFNTDSFGWTVASKGFDTKSPSVLRLCQVPKPFEYFVYPERIHIYWSMLEPYETGLPTPEENKRLEEFENLITQSMLPSNHAILVLTITGGSAREFVFYSKTVDEFMSRLQHMPHTHGSFPIALECSSDAEWSYYKDVASQVGET